MPAAKVNSIRAFLVGLLVVLPSALSVGKTVEAQLPSAKVARSSKGMVATSTPYGTAAGVRILEKGGNAVDAAAAAAFALMVTDPPMNSLGGRVQVVMALRDGQVVAFDGATWTPGAAPPLEGEEDDRTGIQLSPVPGNPATLALMVERYGRLPLAEVLEPAIEFAEQGFRVSPTVGAIWENVREKLAANPGAAANYLKEDSSPYREGEVFKHPRLARLLRALAESGPEVFYRGWIAEAIEKDMEAGGGYVRRADLEAYQPQPAVTVQFEYRGYQLVMPARHARGSTLAEMLRALERLSLQRGAPSAREVELMARVMAESFADRPSILEPIPATGPRLDVGEAEEYARKRVERIREKLEKPSEELQPATTKEGVSETTHLSVMDAEGNAVALTTSIGPVFGDGIATEELGFLYAHSYRLDTRPLAHQRDYTEMTPTIVLRGGRPVLVVGAAGGARIPGAILQVLSNIIDRGYSLEKAVAAPRVFCRRGMSCRCTKTSRLRCWSGCGGAALRWR
jgi:gamma-glutamyltranspeptidase/glutathione hydrolase